jgi:hypothetical protein
MTRPGSDPVYQRSRRKQDLLLASHLARGQMTRALDEFAERADVVWFRAVQVRVWLQSPLLVAAGSATAALVLGVALRRRMRVLRLLRWSWLAWRLWRSAARARALYLAAR